MCGCYRPFSCKIMESLKEILHSRNCSCVVENRGEVRLFHNRGIKDLYTIYTTEPTLLCGAKIADKVIGRAAAALMILGGVEYLYTDVISELALELLNKSSIRISYNRSVPHIINRAQTDLCPMEKATRDIESLDKIFAEIDNFVRSLV